MATKTGTVTVDTTTPPPENLGEVFYNFLANIDGLSAPGETSFVAHSTDGSFDVDILIEGTGFKYDSFGNITGGMATGFTITDNNDGDAPLVHATFSTGMSVIAVKKAADFLFDNPGDTSKLDAIFGAYAITFHGEAATTAETWSSGNTSDTLIGGAGNDILLGGGGNDTIEGGAGNDNLDGGAGTGDTVSYENSGSGVTINLGLQATIDINDDFVGGLPQSGGHAQGDLLAGFEGVIGSAFDDVLFADQDSAKTAGYRLIGGDGDDYMQGGFGKDVLQGGDGNDEGFLGLGKGGDTFDGGAGNEDWATFNSGAETAGITITLGANGTLTGFKAAGGAAASSKITNVENVGGTTLNDVLTGNNLDNELDGGASGNDVLSGMAGDDTLTGDDGDDKLIGGAGNDILDADDGSDTVDYSASAAAVTVDLLQQGDYLTPGNPDSGRNPATPGTPGNGGDAEGDLYFGIENVIGSKFNDTLVAADAGSRLDAGAGDDEVVGGVGLDQLIGGVGADYLIYENSVGGITINLSQQSTVDKTGNLIGGSVAHGGDAEGDKLSGIENITGGIGDDVLIGDKNANAFWGGDGNDRLGGGAGNDTLGGGGDDDTFVYNGLGKDVIEDFTSGEDQVELTGGDVFTSVLDITSRAKLNGDGDVYLDFGKGNTLTFTGITDASNLQLSDFVSNAPIKGTTGNDTLTGDALANTIDGLAGDDFIEGKEGGDTLIGGAGNDILSYEHSGAGVTVTLVAKQAAQASGGDADGDVATLFEYIVGSDFDDELTGDSGNNGIHGADGEDSINGGAGNDLLIGGLGNDTIDGGANNDTAEYSYYVGGQIFALTIALDASGNATTSGNANDIDALSSIENLTGGGENDFFTGNAGINVLKGGTGDDTLNGGGGKDILDGGDGDDRADFTGAMANLTIALKDNGAMTTVAGGGAYAGTQLIGIENLTGSASDDKLTGNAGDNNILGGAGDDIITASLGADSYDGGNNSDTLTFAAFKTAVTVDLGAGTGSATGGAYAVANFETLIGGSGADVLTTSGVGATTVHGGGGDDMIAGGAIGDSLDGGIGADTVDFSDEAGPLLIDLRQQYTVNAKTGEFVAGANSASQDGYFLAGFENLAGGLSNDTLIGDKGNNTIEGGADNDLIAGGPGGVDTVSYAHDTTGVTVDLGLQGVVDYGSGNSFSIPLAQTGTAQSGGHAAGDLLYGFVNIIGGSGSDILTGNGANNTIDGGGGEDTLAGYAGNDILRGGANNDLFIGGGAAGVGADTYDGGFDNGVSGNNRVDYSDETVGLTVTLGVDGKAAKVNGGVGSNAKGDTLLNIDRVIGGSGNDILTGHNFNHRLEGGDGDDVLKGGTGNSTLGGGAGDDKIFASLGGTETYSGGDDTDTLTFETFTTGVSVTIGQTFVSGSAAGIGTLTVGDDFEILIGGKGADILGAGALGATVNGGAGNDTVIGGAGIDILIGGGNIDTLSYENSADDISVTLGDKGAAATVMSGGDANGDTATGFTNLLGGMGNDTLDGSLDTVANIIDGGASGNDTLTGGANDTVSYAHAAVGINVTLSLSGIATGNGPGGVPGGGASGDIITGFKSIIGSDFNDLLAGGSGGSILTGGLGDDVLGGGTGNNTLIGGDGTDIASFSFADNAVTISLAAGTAKRGGSTDTLQSVEGVFGSDFSDVFNAKGFSHTSKNAGSTGISNEDGSFNSFRGGDGNDSITGNGVTRVRYDDSTNSVAVNLDNISHQFMSSPTVAAHQAMGFDVGIDTFGDGNPLHDTGISQVQGGSNSDVFWGGSGDETFIGGGGDDAIFGGAGFDAARYNVGNSLSGANGISVDLASGDVQGRTGTATTAIGHDLLDGIESIIGTNGDDIFDATGYGDIGATNVGSNGAFNNFEGVGGDDTVTGNGDTRVSYQRATGGVVVELTAGGAGSGSGAGVGSDTFTGGVSAIRGSEFDDQITGNGEDDLLDGWLGNDTLIGGAGLDTFKYSIGIQTGGGADLIVGFELHTDQVDLTGSGVKTMAALAKMMTDDGSDVVINFGSGNTLTIEGVNKIDLDLTVHSTDFLLA